MYKNLLKFFDKKKDNSEQRKILVAKRSDNSKQTISNVDKGKNLIITNKEETTGIIRGKRKINDEEGPPVKKNINDSDISNLSHETTKYSSLKRVANITCSSATSSSCSNEEVKETPRIFSCESEKYNKALENDDKIQKVLSPSERLNFIRQTLENKKGVIIKPHTIIPPDPEDLEPPSKNKTNIEKEKLLDEHEKKISSNNTSKVYRFESFNEKRKYIHY